MEEIEPSEFKYSTRTEYVHALRLTEEENEQLENKIDELREEICDLTEVVEKIKRIVNVTGVTNDMKINSIKNTLKILEK